MIAHNGIVYSWMEFEGCFEISMQWECQSCHIELLRETGGCALKLSRDRFLGPEFLCSFARFMLQKSIVALLIENNKRQVIRVTL